MSVIIPFGDSQSRGALANTTVYQRRRGQVFVRKYATPHNPKSALQLDQRTKFQNAILSWQNLPEVDKDQWRQNATGKVQTGYNLYVRWYLIYHAPSTTPLNIQTCEGWEITTLRSTDSTGWFVRIYPYPFGNPFMTRVDNSNQLITGVTSRPPGYPVWLIFIASGQLINIPAGDTFKVTFDGAQEQLIYVPEMVNQSNVQLYVADDGSTYWDLALTNLAFGAP